MHILGKYEFAVVMKSEHKTAHIVTADAAI